MDMHIPKSVSSAIGRSWVREERKRIREALKAEFQSVYNEVASLNHGETESDWLDAVRITHRDLLRAALKVVRR